MYIFSFAPSYGACVFKKHFTVLHFYLEEVHYLPTWAVTIFLPGIAVSILITLQIKFEFASIK